VVRGQRRRAPWPSLSGEAPARSGLLIVFFFPSLFLLARSTSGSVGSSSASMTIDRKPERADAAHLLVICYSSFSD
jgi:hypothetical protein